MFENQRKSLILTLRAKREMFSGQKFIKSAKNGQIWRFFWKPETYGQTVLPDRSALIGQKLVENAKIQMRHFE